MEECQEGEREKERDLVALAEEGTAFALATSEGMEILLDVSVANRELWR